jgi:carbamate kinase
MTSEAPLRRTAVIALGGNALAPAGERSSIHDQFLHTRQSIGAIVELALEGWNLCIVHGNGPQVGDELVRNELARSAVAPLPLGVLVAATAGWIGYMIQQSLENALHRAGSARLVTTLITQVHVDPQDPALSAPAKFIGHALQPSWADALMAEGKTVQRDARGRLRRVVGSPMPLRVHESEQISELVERGTIVVACGGGGVPVYRDDVLGLEGVDAVVDKDLAAAVLATDLHAEMLLILTDVDAVYADWGTAAQRPLARLTATEADALCDAGAFGSGSMAPKVRAAAAFVRCGGTRAVIAELKAGQDAVRGLSGTTILREYA